jgi:hypothetical protein
LAFATLQKTFATWQSDFATPRTAFSRREREIVPGGGGFNGGLHRIAKRQTASGPLVYFVPTGIFEATRLEWLKIVCGVSVPAG